MKKQLLLLCALWLLGSSVWQHTWAQTPQSVGGWQIPAGNVSTITSDNDYVYMGGSFRGFYQPNVRGVKGSGSGVSTSGRGEAILGFPEVNGDINTVISDGAGGWYIGGNFTSVGGVTRSRVARIKADKTLDANWNPNAFGTVSSLLLLDGSVYIGGEFNKMGGTTRNNLAKVDANTGNLATWNPNTNGSVNSMVVSGTSLYIGGSFTTIGGTTRNRIARVSTSGTGALESWYPTGGANNAVSTLLVSGTSVFVGGDFTTIGGQSRSRLAKLSTASNTVDAWNPGVTASFTPSVHCMALSGTDLYIGGFFTTVGGQARNALAKVDASSGTVNTWNAGVNNTIYGISTVSAIAIEGTYIYAGGRGVAARFDASSAEIDDTWKPIILPSSFTTSSIRSISFSSGNLYVGGDIDAIGGFATPNLARLHKNTLALDTTWTPNPNNDVYAIAIAGSDVYVGGQFTSIDGQSRNSLAKLSNTGAGNADATWNPNPSGTINAIAIAGSNVYVGGSFYSIGGQSRNLVAKLSSTGTGDADAAWNANITGIITPRVNAIAVSGTDLYLAGKSISTVGGINRKLAKVSASTGAVDATWNPNADGDVNTLVISGSDIYVGGWFISIGGQTRNRIAKLNNTNGAADATWNPNANNGVSAIAISGSDIYVGGYFSSIGGLSRARLAKISSTGTGAADATWSADCDNTVNAIHAMGNKLFVGGEFTTIGGQAIPVIAYVPIPNKSITASGTLSALSTTYGAASANSSFMVSGEDLTAGVTVTAPVGFEVSTAAGSGFANSIVVGAAPTVSSTTVYVRLTASATPAIYSGNITCASAGAPTQNVAIPNSTVNTKALTISGLSAQNKIADGTTAATLSGTASLVGIVGSDNVSLAGTATATFASAAAGNNIAVNITGLSLTGAQASYYTLTLPSLTANITPCVVTVSPSTLSAGLQGVAYNVTFSQTGIASGAVFSISSGDLPAGLSLSSGGVLSGTPTESGIFAIAVQASNGICTGSRVYALSIGSACGTVSISPNALSAGTQGLAYSATITQSGLVSPTFNVTSGALPAGLTLSGGGVLSGTPSVNGTFNFTVTASQGACSGSKAYTLNVGTSSTGNCTNPALTIVAIGASVVDISWTPDPTNSLGYEVQWRKGSDHWNGPSRFATSLAAYRIPNLIQNSTYTVRFRSVCSIGINDWDNYTVSTAGLFTCNAPTVTINNVGASIADISWAAESNTAGYEVNWRKGTDPWNGQRFAAGVTSYRIPNLQSNSLYEYRVRSLCTPINEWTLWVTGGSFTTESLFTCNAPTATINNVGVSIADISWAAESNTAGYEVNWRKSTDPWNGLRFAVGVTSYRIPNLQSNTLYEYRVRSLCTPLNEWTNWATGTFTTNVLTTCSPLVASVGEIGGTTVKISWASNTAGTNAYEIRWRAQGFPFWNSYAEMVSSTERILYNLKPSTTYEWQIRNACGSDFTWNAWSGVSTFTTTGGGRLGSIELNVYPNPSTGLVNISGVTEAMYYVYNALGQMVASGEITSEKSTLDLSAQASGMYLLKVVSGGAVQTKQITINR